MLSILASGDYKLLANFNDVEMNKVNNFEFSFTIDIIWE